MDIMNFVTSIAQNEITNWVLGGILSLGLLKYLYDKIMHILNPKQHFYNMGWSIGGNIRRGLNKIKDPNIRNDMRQKACNMFNHIDLGLEDRIYNRSKRTLK